MRRWLAWGLALAACAPQPAAREPERIGVSTAAPSASAASSTAAPAASSAPAPASASVEKPPEKAEKAEKPLAEPGREALARALAAEWKAAPKTSAYFVGTTGGAVVAAHQEKTPLIPASNTKLLTTSAALTLLGPDHRMTTQVHVVGRNGDRAKALVVVGRHDVTWSDLFFDDAMAPVRQIADKVKAAGIARADVLVVKGAPLFAPKRFEELDLAKHRDTAAQKLRQALGKAGVAVGRVKGASGFAVPEDAALLFEHASPPLAKVVEPINRLSHNPLADALLLHLGLEKGGEATFAAGAKAEAEFAKAVGVDGLSAADGSGLSRNNAFTAEGLAKLLLVMQRGEHRDVFVSSLATAGETGTLKNRFAEGSAKGRFRGKTGTLDGVVSLSGYLAHPTDGRTYVVVMLMNGTTDGAVARRLEDRVVELVAQSSM